VKILVAFEESFTLTGKLRVMGHDAYSCDLLPTRGDSRYHIQGDGIEVAEREDWDAMIAFPPCTHIAVSGARHFAAKRADGRQQQGIDLFMATARAVEEIGQGAIENPIGIMSNLYRKPDQIIQPWQFGHGETKATCLWLVGLPLLVPSNVVDGRTARVHRMPPGPLRARERSKTFDGIADAMAWQWFPVPTERRSLT